MRKIIELNFGMGNIRSLQKAFEHLGENVIVSEEANDIDDAYALLLPGDGAFGKAMSEIKSRKMHDKIIEFHEKDRPILGVCIGFQILFSSSTEFGSQNGFNFFEGNIERFPDSVITPHMGWNKTFLNENKKDEPRLMKGIKNGAYFYYVHSYRYNGIHPYASAYSKYETPFTSILEYPEKNLYATQFHPEKSHDDGLKVLKNFLEVI